MRRDSEFEGEVFGAYRIGAKLGAGGIGEVYNAAHVRTGRQYAVKVLHDTDPLALKRFRREAEALASIGHAGVVAVHDFDETPDGTLFLVMDKLVGEDLAARLERGALSEEEALARFTEMCDALEAAHSAGVLHRDLKPSNIFLAGTPPRCVLLDFGLAKQIGGEQTTLTATGQAMGTPMYMSPEQALGESVDARTDVYSLAAVLYEMFLGRPPFEGRTVTAILSKVLTFPPPSLRSRGANVSENLERAILRAMAKDRNERPASITAFRRAVMGASLPQTLASVPAEPAPQAETSANTPREAAETPAARAAATSKGRSAPIAVAILAAAGAVAGALLWSSSSTPSVEPVAAAAVRVAPADAGAAPVDLGVPDTFVPDSGALPAGPSNPAPRERATMGMAARRTKRSSSAHREARMAAPTMQTMEAAPAAVPAPSVPPGARETLARNIADTRLRIDGYQRFVRAVGRLRARGTDAPTVCRSAFDRTFAGDDSQLQHLASGIERARDRMCELHTEILSPPPDRVRSLERLRANFDRRRRDLRNRRPDVLAPADLEELLRRVDAVEVAMQPTPPRCASPSHEALRSYARNLGPRAAQPALQIGYSVGRVCTRPLQLPSRELGYLQAMERSQSAAEENIRIHSDILARLQQIHYP